MINEGKQWETKIVGNVKEIFSGKGNIQLSDIEHLNDEHFDLDDCVFDLWNDGNHRTKFLYRASHIPSGVCVVNEDYPFYHDWTPYSSCRLPHLINLINELKQEVNTKLVSPKE